MNTKRGMIRRVAWRTALRVAAVLRTETGGHMHRQCPGLSAAAGRPAADRSGCLLLVLWFIGLVQICIQKW